MKRSIASAPVIGVECPKCAATHTVLADENLWKRSYSCPECYHVWDIATIVVDPKNQ